jgi:hypothetical protein
MEKSDPRGPRSDEEMIGKHPIFRNHNCWKCKDGEKECPWNYNCEYPHARND